MTRINKTANAWLLIAVLSFLPAMAIAETPGEPAKTKAETGAPYIKIKPKNGVFDIIVLGDSLAVGLHQGLTQLNKDRDDISTTRMAKVNTGLVRRDRFDWNKAARKVGRKKKYQIAVVVMGPNDLQSIREKGKAHHFQQDGWVERYKQRLELLIQDLKSGGTAVYWVGIPITAPNK